MKKKMKRYQDGGDVIELQSKMGENENISNETRAKAMAAVAAGGQKDEAPAVPKKTAEKLTPKAAPKTEPKAAAPKTEPKAAAPKAESKTEKQKTSGEEPSFLKGTKGFKNLGEAFKAMRRSAGITSYKSGGKVSSASKRADGCAIRGKTRA